MVRNTFSEGYSLSVILTYHPFSNSTRINLDGWYSTDCFFVSSMLNIFMLFWWIYYPYADCLRTSSLVLVSTMEVKCCSGYSSGCIGKLINDVIIQIIF